MGLYAKYGKQWIDISLVGLLLLILLPLLLLLSIAIKLDSQGSIFFCQPRIGKGGRVFKLIKFRTMVSDKNAEELQFTPGEKQRVTRVGKILRPTKLDELPVFINVLKGEMSIVGPRPEVPKYLSFYKGEYAKILTLKPGITDLASIKYRNEEEILANSDTPDLLYQQNILPDKLKINLIYLNSISFCGDIHIIFFTLKAVLYKS